ncbi:hypothetical protein CcCBS67573_g05826 [Chytriomyces confervae]|uniref:Uncharacterized protein n=1 Tax=Chytriomyces confervae TaxID=246404 RepID=A0A507FAZ1_9FUNG|nr:hypothetical protein CcCBS67573_g05826 [Chytriomyces confervae]
MGFERFMTKHFGGVPRSLKDFEWIYRVVSSRICLLCADFSISTQSLHQFSVLPTQLSSLRPTNTEPCLLGTFAISRMTPNIRIRNDVLNFGTPILQLEKTSQNSLSILRSQPAFARPNVDKINKNYYYTRDVRRAYPATAVYSTEDIAKIVGASQARIGSGSPDSTVSINALPPAAPGIKHVYESSLPHLGPSDLNPDLHIRGVK